MKRAGRSQLVSLTMRHAKFFPTAIKMNLRINMRLGQEAEQGWSEYLFSVGEGKAPTDENSTLTLPEDIQSAIEELIDVVFGSLMDPNKFSSCAILAAKNDDVNRINDVAVDKWDGEQRVYYSTDSALHSEFQHLYPVEFLNSLCYGGLPPHKLTLKAGIIIMLLRNLDKTNGLCNGTRLRILRLHERFISAEILTAGAQYVGKVVLLPKTKMNPIENTSTVQFTRYQFPIRVGFAMTINTSQCQNLETVEFFAPEDIFAHGQLYVGLSRSTRGAQGIVTLGRVATNIVYEEVLSND